MANSKFAAGASASLNKTITAIMKFLEDDDARPSQGFRAFLHEKIADLNLHWFRRGFNRGHKESLRHFHDDGEVPAKLRYEGHRTLFTGHKRKLVLKSTLKSTSKKKRRR